MDQDDDGRRGSISTRVAQVALAAQAGALAVAAYASRTDLATDILLLLCSSAAVAIAWSIARLSNERVRTLEATVNDCARRRSEADAEAKQKSEFFANLTHEIRTPMTAILGFADVLRSPTLSERERQQHIGTIRRAGEHLLAIVSDILDLSKLEAGRMTVESLEVAPLEVVRDVVELMRGRADERGLRLVVRCDGMIPARIQSDPIRLRQVLLNLVSNAIKFTECGEVAIVLALEGQPTDRAPHLRFEVRDTGIGIRDDQMDRLFRPFMQADGSTTRKYGGTGLGLAISARLVEMLGGTLGVESKPGIGSTFRFRVRTGPLNATTFVSGLDLATRREAASPVVTMSGRVLLAEDGIDNQRLLTLHLRTIGLDVDIATNGREAIDAAIRSLSSRPFDLILMDLQMPTLDGMGATKELRAKGWNGPILALTASAHADAKSDALASGCDDILTKPIDRATLADACRRWIRANTQRAEAA
ncbi:MAG: ATP-binding protein [Phycisphaerales bacterium]